MNFIRKTAVLTFQQQQVLFPMKSANNFAFLFHSGRIFGYMFLLRRERPQPYGYSLSLSFLLDEPIAFQNFLYSQIRFETFSGNFLDYCCSFCPCAVTLRKPIHSVFIPTG